MNYKTGSRNLDNLLDGGLPGGAITTIMGGTGTGRTTLALATAVSAVRQKKKVAWFDCEAGLNANMLFNLGLTQEFFSTYAPQDLETCLSRSIVSVSSGEVGLVVLDSANQLTSSRGSVASVAGIFTNWMPKIQQALGVHKDTALLIGWQLKRDMTRQERKTGNFGFPTILEHGTSVALLLEKHYDDDGNEEGIEVMVTKDRRVGHMEPPSCIIKLTGHGVFHDVRVAKEPIDRSKIPTRFDREPPI